MNRFFERLRWATCFFALLLLGGLPSRATAQLVDLATAPLFAGLQAHPNVVLSTSVEFPSVGAAYLGTNYNPALAYLGYFDPTKCYRFNGDNVAGTGYFAPSGAANASHECSNAFSGNFMNFVTMSAIDEFRYAMTGGNRVDENGASNGTVLQRATLPDGTVSGVPSFYAYASNFPSRVILNASTVLPNSVTTLGLATVNNCGNYVYFSLAIAVGSCNIANNTHPPFQPASGVFPVRVLVCDDSEGPTRTDLCLQYGANGKYKPVGQIQINAAKMRFASFGYLMDRNLPSYTVPSGCDDGTGWNRCRYGGVLRAPMKYVGPTKYDANQSPSTNTAAEVDAAGILLPNPEGNAVSAGGYSGVINFINKFGSSGVYKRLDPGGEMFYEAIRYLQNLGPTGLAASGMPGNTAAKNAVLDYFPITTTWTDPIASTCSANYIINLSDANMWDDTYLPGYNGSPGAGVGRPGSRPVEGGLDAYAWTQKIGTLESVTPSIAANDVRPGLAGIENRYFNAGQRGTYFAAGAAFWANVNDIRTDLAGTQTIKTISFDVGEDAGDIHDRQLYLMGKYGGFNNTIDRPTDTYPNPFYASNPANPNVAIRSNSEWADSTGNPTNYLLASDPQKLINGIRSAFRNIGSSTGSLSGAAITSASLAFGSSGAYVATFKPGVWSGSIVFKSLTVANAATGSVNTATIWDAGLLLTARCGSVASGSTVCTDTDASATRRNIVTTIKTAGVRVAQPFTWANVSTDSAYATTLNFNAALGAADGKGQERLNYLRGYRADEASALAFRLRDSAMGDVINSGPVYVAGPTTAISDADYQPFYLANANRAAAVYFGANDGMLHALDATSGTELFAYIPNFVKDDLNRLSNPGYQHVPYVDAVPSIQEVKSNGTWKTVLVSGVGAGAQGVFALDVSDPNTFAASKVIFEFTDADDPDFGNVVTSPKIVKLQTGVSGSLPTYSYFAAVTGYNNRRTTFNGRVDSDVSADTNNKGVLFLLSMDRTLGTPWMLGTNYYKFTFPAIAPTAANGLGPVSSFDNRNGSGAAAALYFGDLQGDLWRLNTVGLPSAWVPSAGTVAAPVPLFRATTGGTVPVRQPITARPTLATGPFGSTLVYFGTGEYLGTSDLLSPFAQQSEYALLDNNSGTTITRSNLAVRTGTVSGTQVLVTGPAFSYTGAAAKKGWVVDFPSRSIGERSITQPAISNGLLTFTSLTLSTDVCGQSGGYIYQLNALTGLPYTDTLGNVLPGGTLSTVGIPGPPLVVDLVVASGRLRPTGEVINTRTQTTLVSGTTTDINGTQAIVGKAPPIGRINWREITNYNDRH